MAIGLIVTVSFEKILKLYNSWKVDKILKKNQAGEVNDTSLEDSKYGIIDVVENGFQVKSTTNSETIYIAWSDITEIMTFKRDLGTTDLICLGWKTDENTFL